MGTKYSIDKPSTSIKSLIKFEYLIGKGGFSNVWKVSFIRDNLYNNKPSYYAMKQISKAKIIKNDTVSSLIKERHLLEIMNHPFIIKMKYAFQDKYYLYIIMDYHKGGDLRYHLLNDIKFNEEQTSKIYLLLIIIYRVYCLFNYSWVVIYEQQKYIT